MEKKTFERPVIKKLNAGMPSKFGMQVRHDPITEIDGVPVASLLERYGSPLFIYSEKTIRRTYKEAFRAFSSRYPNVLFSWSYKTNYLNAICNIFHQEGSWAEVVSGFEYQKALANGVKGDRIIFNGPDKSRADLQLAVENGSLIHIDHFDELYELIEVAGETQTRPQVAIRVNMDTGIYPAWDRFGFNYENGEAWDALNRIMHCENLELAGLHTHIGTYIMGTEPYRIAATKLAELAVGLERKFSHHIRYIDMGGGFASRNTLKGGYYPGSDTTPSFEDYAEAIVSVLMKADFHPDHLPLLILETGRALIDDAGFLAGTVIATKRLADGQRASILDARGQPALHFLLVRPRHPSGQTRIRPDRGNGVFRSALHEHRCYQKKHPLSASEKGRPLRHSAGWRLQQYTVAAVHHVAAQCCFDRQRL